MSIRLITMTALVISVTNQTLQAEKKQLTQVDENIPGGIRYLDSLHNPSSSIDFPGLQSSSQTKAIRAGYVLPQNVNPENHTTTAENLNRLSPYASIELPFNSFQTGVYVGNLQMDFSERNALDALDTVRQSRRSLFSLNGGLWCTSVSKHLKGISMFFEGNTDYNFSHTTDTDIWKRLHTDTSNKLQYGAGTLSGAFSFFNNDYWVTRIHYGRSDESSHRQLTDTLYFTDDYFVNSTSMFETSCINMKFGAEIGYIFRNKQKKLSAGCIVGQDQSTADIGNYLNYAASTQITLFLQKHITFKKATVYTGGNFLYAGTFNQRQDVPAGLLSLVRSYTLQQSSHDINFAIPLLLEFRPVQQLTLLWGAEINCRNTISNYNIERNQANISRNSVVYYDLCPLGIRYTPNSKIAVGFTPSIQQKVLISSLEVSITF